jgi:hypothetical protein
MHLDRSLMKFQHIAIYSLHETTTYVSKLLTPNLLFRAHMHLQGILRMKLSPHLKIHVINFNPTFPSHYTMLEMFDFLLKLKIGGVGGGTNRENI